MEYIEVRMGEKEENIDRRRRKTKLKLRKKREK